MCVVLLPALGRQSPVRELLGELKSQVQFQEAAIIVTTNKKKTKTEIPRRCYSEVDTRPDPSCLFHPIQNSKG